MALDIAALARSLDGAGEVREAGVDDVVDGVPASVVARPTSVEGVSAVLREATGQGLVTVARGAGTALGWGSPPERVDLILDVGGLDRLVEHEAGRPVVAAGVGAQHLGVLVGVDLGDPAAGELHLQAGDDRPAEEQRLGRRDVALGPLGVRRGEHLLGREVGHVDDAVDRLE
ncbi:MAG: FAD-binding oxidoreductase, partial [Actinomycetales bacterium]|nr:FAD-binding oxidoreductase [Actinomycetales bacterium]